jgi:hypothetical protein
MIAPATPGGARWRWKRKFGSVAEAPVTVIVMSNVPVRAL